MYRLMFQRYVGGMFLFLLSLLTVSVLCRISFIINAGLIKGALGDVYTLSDIGLALFNGGRYDARMIAFSAIFASVLFIISAFFKKHDYAMTIFASIYAFIIIFLSVCNIGYFGIYGDTFNAILLGMIYDDRGAIFQTAYSGEYSIIFRTLCVIGSTALFAFLYLKLSKMITSMRVIKFRYVFVSFALFVYVAVLMITSTFNMVGGSLDYLITPAKNPFLRKVTPGATRDLYVVYNNHKTTMSRSFEYYTKGIAPREAATIYFDKQLPAEPIDLNQYLSRTVSSGTDKKYKHVFLIIAESLSRWHFDDKYDELELVSGLKSLIAEKNGYSVPNFIEGAEGTIGTVDTILTGHYVTDIPLHTKVGALEEFPMSLGVFKRLGYKTNFYYFGSGTWRNIETYAYTQGIDNVYTLSEMEGKRRGVWGVFDSEGFDFISEQLDKANDEPTFNLVLTTSNHPPYDLPFEELGPQLSEMREYLDKNVPSETVFGKLTPEILVSTWYSDKELHRFIKHITYTYPDSLVVVTGDHFDRRHPEADIDIFTLSGVPFIIYGRDIENASALSTAGAHIDIVPTMLELTAPKGFEYKSFGRPLLSVGESIPDADNVSLGYYAMAGERMVAAGIDELNNSVIYLNGAEPREGDEEYVKKHLTRLKMGKALSWYIINKGYVIE